MTVGPAIRLRLDDDGAHIEQRRPAVVTALHDRRPEEALELLPLLLPVCGDAQRIAAERALEAALGHPCSDALHHERERSLLREQARAALWRIHVDLPPLLDEPTDHGRLRALRDAGDDAARAAVLRACVAGLEHAEDAEAIRRWATGGESPGARWLAQLDALGDAGDAAIEALAGGALASRGRTLLDAPAFDALAPALTGPVEVGPLAQLGDGERSRLDGLGLLARRGAALLLDVLRTAAALEAANPASSAPAGEHWAEGSLTGTGRAQTARGPVFHRIEVADDGRIADWRVLAPTDWHFAPNGAVAATCAALDRDQGAVGLAVATFDPCAPVHVDPDAAVSAP